MGISRPPDSTGGKGLPVATMASPSVHASTCSGVASTCRDGLLSGKMIGRAFTSRIARTTSSEKSPAWPDTPMRMSGLAPRTTSRSDG